MGRQNVPDEKEPKVLEFYKQILKESPADKHASVHLVARWLLNALRSSSSSSSSSSLSSSVTATSSVDSLVEIWPLLSQLVTLDPKYTPQILSAHSSILSFLTSAILNIPSFPSLAQDLLNIVPKLASFVDSALPANLDQALHLRSAALKAITDPNFFLFYHDSGPTDLVSCIFSHTQPIFADAPDSASKKISSHILSTDLPNIIKLVPHFSSSLYDPDFFVTFNKQKLQQYQSPSISNTLYLILEHLSQAIFSLPNLKRSLSQQGNITGADELIQTLTGLIDSNHESRENIINLLPFLHSMHAHNLKKYGTSLFPLSVQRNGPEPSQSAQEAHSLSKMRITSHNFLRSFMFLLTKPNPAPNCLYCVIASIQQNSAYHPLASGSSTSTSSSSNAPSWRGTLLELVTYLKVIISTSQDIESKEYAAKGLNILFDLDTNALEDSLVGLLSLISVDSSKSSPMSCYQDLLKILLSNYSKLKQQNRFLQLIRQATNNTMINSNDDINRTYVNISSGPLFHPSFIYNLRNNLHTRFLSTHATSTIEGLFSEFKKCAEIISKLDQDTSSHKKQKKDTSETTITTLPSPSVSTSCAYLILLTNWINIFISSADFIGNEQRHNATDVLKTFAQQVTLPLLESNIPDSKENDSDISDAKSCIIIASLRLQSCVVEAIRDLTLDEEDDIQQGQENSSKSSFKFDDSTRDRLLNLVASNDEEPSKKKKRKTSSNGKSKFYVEAKYEIVRALLLEDIPHQESITLSLDIANTFSSTESYNQWNGILAGLEDSNFAEAIWHLICTNFIERIDRYGSEKNFDQISRMIFKPKYAKFEQYSSCENITNDLLRDAYFFELGQIRDRIIHFLIQEHKDDGLLIADTDMMDLDSKSENTRLQNCLLQKLLLFPDSYFPLSLRRQLIETTYKLSQVSESKGAIQNQIASRTILKRYILSDDNFHPTLRNIDTLVTFLNLPSDVDSELFQVSVDLLQAVLTTAIKTSSIPTNKLVHKMLKKAFKKVQSQEESLASRIKHIKTKKYIDQSKLVLSSAEHAFTVVLQVISANPKALSNMDLGSYDWSTVLKWNKDVAAAGNKRLSKRSAKDASCLPFLFNQVLELYTCFSRVKLLADLNSPSPEGGDDDDGYNFIRKIMSSSVYEITNINDYSGNELDVFKTFVQDTCLNLCRIYSLLGSKVVLLQELFTGLLVLETAIGYSNFSSVKDEMSLCIKTASLQEFSKTTDIFIEDIAIQKSSVLNMEIDPLIFLGILVSSTPSEGSSFDIRELISLSLRKLLAKRQEGGCDDYFSSHASPEDILSVSRLLLQICVNKVGLLQRHDILCIWSILYGIVSPRGGENTEERPKLSNDKEEIVKTLLHIVSQISRHRRDLVIPTFSEMMKVLSGITRLFSLKGHSGRLDDREERISAARFPRWAWIISSSQDNFGKQDAQELGKILTGLTTRLVGIPTLHLKKTLTTSSNLTTLSTSSSTPTSTSTSTSISLTGALSKHAPFYVLEYVKTCVDDKCGIPPEIRSELLTGMTDVIQTMGSHERASIMDGFLGKDEDRERTLLRALCSEADRIQYKGE